MSLNDANPDNDFWSKIAAEDWDQKQNAIAEAKRDRLTPGELAEKSLELLGDLHWITQHESADQWIHLQSLETVYDDNGDHFDESNLQRVFDHFTDVCERCEWLSHRLAWSGVEYAKPAMKLLSKVRLAITGRSNLDRSEAELAQRAGRTETVVRYLAGNVDRIKAFESELTDLIAEIQTVQEMDRGIEQAEAASPPAYAVAMQEAIEAGEETRKQARQVAFAVNVIDGHRQAWENAWETFGPCLVAYLAGESSRSMVESLAVLDGVIESVGFDESLAALNAGGSFPKFDNQRDQIDAAVCRLVIGVWAALRFDRKDRDTLIAELDAITARVATESVGFVRDLIEAGGLRECFECGEQLTPSQVGPGRCCNCIARQRKTLRWLGVAIECEYRYDNRVYGDGFDAHFPEWSRWRRRLRECYGRDRTDWQLWEDWIGYAQEHRGIEEQQFKGTLRSEAESLLPTPNRGSQQVISVARETGSITHGDDQQKESSPTDGVLSLSNIVKNQTVRRLLSELSAFGNAGKRLDHIEQSLYNANLLLILDKHQLIQFATLNSYWSGDGKQHIASEIREIDWEQYNNGSPKKPLKECLPDWIAREPESLRRWIRLSPSGFAVCAEIEFADELGNPRPDKEEMIAGPKSKPATEAQTDDSLPKSKRASSPSRVKARSAYDYAIERIENAHAMTGPELHAAILEDGEAAAMVPANPETFVRYLNDGGIRLKKGESKSAGGSVVRRSDL
ncbi:hypothetical protein [Neorhodopirellula pilleata]|uniref:Uncharacterized protein n=1 Tax=Neorhodopirellula pilleata TaxID=2714738 RepID=A0A5C5ZYQ2_9BACT|nr:hypothetical protein [Neorhodopirellula pilleata]TWT92175.1 hypothetical protein Pla100_47110 [Neorhodopirellula pilleata]